MLNLVGQLLDSWHSNGVIYCHWKSNDAIERGLIGEGDLDILVSQHSTAAAYNSLTSLGFKRLQEPPRTGYPGIEHWLGLSEEGTFVHLHLHFRLVYGEKFIKGHRYADEEGILARRILDRGVYQISRADELVLLFTRTVLKVDFIWIAKRLAGLQKQYFPKHIMEEYGFLSKGVTNEAFEEACEAFLPGISKNDIRQGIDTIAGFNLLKLLRWRFRLRRELAFSQRLSRLEGWKAFFRVYILFFLGKLGLYKKPKKKLYSGGRTIALLGADGAGKSTMVDELQQWLGYFLDVETLYGGTGDGKKSLSLTLFDAVMAPLSSQKKKAASGQPNKVPGGTQKRQSTIKVLLKNIRAALITQHRLATVRQSSRLSNNGKIVLLDRFPQPFQRNYSDGPKALKQEGAKPSRLYRWEQAAYEKMFANFSDHCFILMVDPDVSVARKPENVAEIIVAKNEILKEIARRKESQTVILDANMDYEKVLNTLKRQVWEWL